MSGSKRESKKGRKDKARKIVRQQDRKKGRKEKNKGRKDKARTSVRKQARKQGSK